MPAGVKYTVEGNIVRVEGPKGTMEQHLPAGITLETKDGNLIAERDDNGYPTNGSAGLSDRRRA